MNILATKKQGKESPGLYYVHYKYIYYNYKYPFSPVGVYELPGESEQFWKVTNVTLSPWESPSYFWVKVTLHTTGGDVLGFKKCDNIIIFQLIGA